jgi:hypothetical protein
MANLESENMFLVDHCQQVEDILARYQGKFVDLVQNTDAAQDQMRKTRDEKQEDLSEIQAKCDDYNFEGEFRRGNELSDVEMRELQAAILVFHSELGFGRESSIGTITMLTRIEEKMELLTAQLAARDEQAVKERTHEKALERREEERAAKNAKDKREQDEKAQRAIQLALMPIKRRTGRPPIRRMIPVGLENRDKRDELHRMRQARRVADEKLLYGATDD